MCVSFLNRRPLKDSLLNTMTELLCSWEERWVTVEDSCEKGTAFQVRSAYESLYCEDAFLLSIQMLCNFTCVDRLIPFDPIQKLALFSHHTSIPTGFKPSKISLCIHSVQACCTLTCHTVSLTTASVLPTLEHVPTDHATQNAHGLLLLMYL